MKIVIALMISLTMAGTAIAEEFLPLEPGNFWSYRDAAGLEELQVVTGQVPIFDANPFAIEYTDSPENQGLINYWSTEPDGDILLWGFFVDGWGYVYQPPIRMLDAPLNIGKSWSTTTLFHTLPDTLPYQTFEAAFTAYEEPVLTVPAGEFTCWGIGPSDPATKAAHQGRYTLWGTVVSDKNAGPDTWYSPGVGVVQYGVGSLLKLETYTDHPVGVQISSWGAVKALYRGD